MKNLRTLIVLGLIFGLASFAVAADIPLSWDVSQGATSYQVQISADMGATWGETRDAGADTAFTWTGAPDTGLLLFRAIAVNAQGQAINTDSGAWYCGDWVLPNKPGGLGVK